MALHGHGGAYRNRTGVNCLEGSCVTATPILRISAGKHYKTGGLSVQLSCVADFRIATVFTLRRSRSFPAARKEKRYTAGSQCRWRKGQDSNLLPSPVLGAAHPHELLLP